MVSLTIIEEVIIVYLECGLNIFFDNQKSRKKVKKIFLKKPPQKRLMIFLSPGEI